MFGENLTVQVADNPNSATDLAMISGAISGGGPTTKTGSGTLILSANNPYTGGTLISSGTLQVGNGGASGSLGSGTVNNYATLVFNRSDLFTNANLIAGTGNLVQSGSGSTAILIGTNTYSGFTLINSGGTLQVGNGGAAGALGSGTVTNNGFLVFNRADLFTNANLIAGTGNLIQSGSGSTAILISNNTYGGFTFINSGTLQVGNGGASGALGSGTVSNYATLAFNRSDVFTNASVITGTGVLVQNGMGTLVLTNSNNTYSGGTVVQSGTLKLAAVGAFPGNALTVTGGIFDENGNAITVTALNGTGGTITNTSGLTDSVGGSFAGVLAGLGVLVHNGGTLALGGANVFSGGVIVSNGLLLAAHNNALGSSPATVINGATLALSNNLSGVGNAVTISGLGASGGGALRNLIGNNIYNGSITLASAARINSDANQLTLGSTGNITNNYSLTVGGVSTTIVSGVIAGSGGLVKDGTGSLYLNSAQTFTGPTTISNGMLVVNGSLLSAGVVNVVTNGILTGSGTVGSVTNYGGGTIAPGNSGVGSITAAALTMATNSQIVFEFNAGAVSYDQLFVTGANGLTVNGGALSLTKVNTTTPFDLLGTYKLIRYNGTLAPTATNLLSVADATQNRLYGFSLSGNWVTLSITSTGGLGWVGSSVNNYWSATNNWAGGIVPVAGDQLIFDGQTGLINTNDLTAHTQFSGIYFNSTAGAFTLNSNAVDLISDVINLSPHTQTINLPLVLAASNLVFNTANGNVVVNGVISETNGAVTLTKDGAATLILTGTNTYSGGTILAAGTLSVGAIADSGASGISTGGGLTLNGGALQFTGAGAGSTTRGITNIGIGIAYLDVTNSAAQLTLGGVISGTNGLMKFGSGTLVLAGTNTYSGGTTISNGTLAISADNNLGAAGGSLTFGGGTLETTNHFALDSTRPITLNSPGGTFNVDTNSTLIVGNTITNGTGSGALTKTGSGTLVFSNAANNYSGGTVINAGILALGADGATNENAGALGSGLVTITGNSQLRLGGGADMNYSISNGIALSAGAIAAVAGVQNLTGSITVNSGGGTLSAQAGTNDLFLTGVVSGSGALTVYDTGAAGAGRGLVRFSNNNNPYSGTLTISSNGNNGVVSLDATNALQFATVNDGAGDGNSLVFYQATAGATNFTLGALSGTANIILQTWTNTASGDPLVTGPAVTLTVGGNNGNTIYAGVLGGSGALIKTGSGIMTLTGANTNSGGVTVSSGTLQLSGGNNRLFTNGAVTLAAGMLDLGGFTQTNSNTFAILSGTLTNGTVAKSGADFLGQSGTISATLAGSAGFTKTTTGTLSLTGAQSYTGATTISNGTLIVNGSLYNAGLVNVLSNATLTGNATLGNVTVGTGGLIVPGNNGIGTFSMGTLTTASGSLFNFDFTATTNDLLLVTANNGLTVTGGVFTLYQAGTTQTFDALGTYNLINYVGTVGGRGVTNFAVANPIGNRSYTFGTNSGAVTLTIAGQGIGWNGGPSVGYMPNWSATNNWNGGNVPTNGTAVFDGNHNVATVNDLANNAVLAGITFATTADAFSLSGNSINLQGDVLNLSPNAQTITLPLVLEGNGGTRTFNASNGTLIVNGLISETNGVFTLVKAGTNRLVLAGLNTYSGGTVLNAGTLGIGISSIGSTGALGIGTLVIHAGGLLATNGAQTFNNAVGVVGDFSVGGNQTLTFAGALDLSNATRTLTINNTANTFIAGAVSNGALTKAGNGLLTVTGTLAYNGSTTINGGTLQLGNGGNTGTINNNAAVTNSGVLAFDRSDDLTFGNLITGPGNVVQNGTNVVTLSNGSSSYSGTTIINGGVLSVGLLSDGGAASPIGAASSPASNLVLNGGALRYAGSGVSVDRLFTVGDNGGTLSAYSAALNFTNTGALGMSGTNSRTLVLTGSGTGLLAASLGDPTSGQTALLKSGSGAWVLSNTNPFSGTTTISGGTLLLAGALAVQNSTVNSLNNGGLVFSNSSAFTLGGLTGAGNLGLTNTAGGSITLSVGNNNSNTTYLGVLSGSGTLAKLGNGTLTLSTNQTYFGGTTVSAGTLQLGGLANTLSTNGAIIVAGGVLNLGGTTQFTTNTVTISGGSLGNGTLTKSGANYDGQAGTVAAVLAGNVGLIKTTGGTLVLTGTNTFTGATLISNGTLQVNGKLISTGLVTVASGATLAGNGGTVGNVTVSSGGSVAPGISGVGTLTLTSLDVTNGSLFNYDFSGTANDQLFVTATNGLAINGGTFQLYQAGSATTFDALGTYKLIDYAGAILRSGFTNFAVANTIDNRTYTFGTNGGWVTLTIAGQGTAWVGSSTNANWSSPANWGDGSRVPTNGIAIFTGTSYLDTTNDLGNARFSGITFADQAGAFTLNSALVGNHTVTLEGDVVNLSANLQTINLPVLIAGAQGGTFNASNGDIAVTGNITFDSYGSGLLKTGPNTLELTGNNSYTQSTTIAGGVLRVNSSGLSPNSNLIFTNGVLESHGVMTVTRSVGTGAGSIQWAGSGGFSANGGTLTVNLGGAGGTLVWGTNSFVPTGSALQFSSSQANSTVNFLNALDLNGGVRTIFVDKGSGFVDVDMTGAISGTTGSGLLKTGAGTLRLSGNSSYAGATVVNDGTLIVNGTLASGTLLLSSSGVLAGTGTLASVVSGSGFIAPGNSPGILTLNQLDPSSGLGFDFQFTSLGSPDYTQAGLSSNDVLRITNAMPFTVALGLANTVNLYVTATLTPGITNIFRGGFYTDNSAGFDTSITGAVYHLYGAGVGALEYVKTVQETAFGKTGYVMEFGVLGQNVVAVIPEPSVALMWLAGGVTLWAARRRRRNHQRVRV